MIQIPFIFVAGDTLFVYVTTNDVSTGSEADATGDPAYRIYNGINGTPVATGSFTKLDDANTTGFYAASISLTGYDPGTYGIRVTATVAGVPGHESAAFRIGGAGPLLVRTTIATLTSQTVFTLTDGPAEANALRYCTVIVRDAADVKQVAVGFCSAYAATTKQITLAEDPGIFTMALGDSVEVYAPVAANPMLLDSNRQALADLRDFADEGYDPATNLINDPAGVTTLLSRIPSALFSGITSLAQWLGLMAGKQTGNATARTELRATGAGSGTFDETFDSQEAIRDRGDVAWITATGFSTLTQADIRTAIGMSAANLDTQIAAVKADTAAILDDTGTSGVVLAAAMCNKIADHVRRRTQANVEASADGDALSLGSIYGFIQQAQESSVSGTTLTVFRTDGSTVLGTKALTVSAGASPVTGVA